MAVAGSQPRIEDFFERLPRAMRKLCVLPNGSASKQKRNDDRPHTDGIHDCLRHPPAKEEHHHGPDGREERYKPDVVEKHVVSR